MLQGVWDVRVGLLFVEEEKPVTGAYLMGGQSDGLGMGLGRKVTYKVSFDSVDYYRMIVFFFMGFGGSIDGNVCGERWW